jgi:hypothetical protein
MSVRLVVSAGSIAGETVTVSGSGIGRPTPRRTTEPARTQATTQRSGSTLVVTGRLQAADFNSTAGKAGAPFGRTATFVGVSARAIHAARVAPANATSDRHASGSFAGSHPAVQNETPASRSVSVSSGSWLSAAISSG